MVFGIGVVYGYLVAEWLGDCLGEDDLGRDTDMYSRKRGDWV